MPAGIHTIMKPQFCLYCVKNSYQLKEQFFAHVFKSTNQLQTVERKWTPKSMTIATIYIEVTQM